MTSKSIPPKTAAKGASSIAPNQTLYCTNLPDRLQKEDLRRSLYMLFSTYGPVLDVVALKTMKMRGQAHIVFRDVRASTQAMKDLQGFSFFGKEMRIEYSKTKSDTIAKLDGTFRGTSASATAAAATELQQSIFNAPPAAVAANSAQNATGPQSPQGTKRPRDEESDAEDVPMEEDDEDEAMEESDED